MAPPAITRSQLAAALAELGVRRDGVLMVHTRMSALGWVVGGSESVVRALLDAVGPRGTLMAYASWQEHVFHASNWPREHRDAYLGEPPAFDLLTSEAAADHGRIPERVRSWPGAERSVHPEASVVALGARARELTEDHPHDDAYGAGTPFARLVESGGQVLMLGAPLETITLLHHAEAIAPIDDKRRVTFRVQVAMPRGVEERTYHDIDTSHGAFPYGRLGLEVDEFEQITRDALAAGIGRRGRAGQADCHLFEAGAIVDFAVAWLVERFGD